MDEITLNETQAAMIVAGIERRERLRQKVQEQHNAILELARQYARMEGLEGDRVQVRQDGETFKVAVLDEPQEDGAEESEADKALDSDG